MGSDNGSLKREAKFYWFRHEKGTIGQLEVTSHRHAKVGFMPSQPKIDLAKLLGPRSLAWVMIHSQFWLVRFTMRLWACRSWSQSGLAYPACLILMFAPASYHKILILRIAQYFLGELEVTGFIAANKCRSYKNYVCYSICHGIGWQNCRRKFLNLFTNHNKLTTLLKANRIFHLHSKII